MISSANFVELFNGLVEWNYCAIKCKLHGPRTEISGHPRTCSSTRSDGWAQSRVLALDRRTRPCLLKVDYD